ncbi:MAG: N-acetylneuraminate synthase family protein [Flavobacteriaceae bacterium]
MKPKQPYLIAEIGGNHEGNFEVAQELVQEAIAAEVDCIKLQIYRGDLLVNPLVSPKRNAHFKKFELSHDQYELLIQQILDAGIDFTASVWDEENFLRYEPYMPWVKIGSGDMTHYPLIQTICQFKKPIYISTGLSHWEEVKDVVAFIEAQHPFYQQRDNIAILQCTSMYPIKNSDANLNVLEQYKTLGHSIGYSDHTEGLNALIAATLLGSEVLEFHFSTASLKATKEFRDHKVSLTQEDIIELKKQLNYWTAFNGKSLKEPYPIELESGHVKTFRRGVYLKENLPKGYRIQLEDLCFLRPCEGISAHLFQDLIGKRLSKPISKHQPLDFNYFE